MLASAELIDLKRMDESHHRITLEDGVLDKSGCLGTCEQTANHVRSRALARDGDAFWVATKRSNDALIEGQGVDDIGECKVWGADRS